jgi:deoxyhypusine synthase
MTDVADFRVNRGCSARELLQKLGTTGFQASKVADAADAIRRMKAEGATIFLTFTANMMASGLRGILTQMVEEGLVDVVVTTGGSIDHDIIKSYKPYILGDFNEDDVRLHKKGVNRIGNILVPNSRFIFLEKKMKRFFTAFHKNKSTFTPTEINDYIGSQLPKGSFLRACHERKVPVFCPGWVDAAVGMHLFFFRQKHKDFILDTAEDLHRLADIVFEADMTAGIILGGGIAKHHTIGANLLRGGLDLAVYVTTASEFDGSLSGAHPKEAKSWGKIKEKGHTVTVYGDVTLVMPLIMAGL